MESIHDVGRATKNIQYQTGYMQPCHPKWQGENLLISKIAYCLSGHQPSQAVAFELASRREPSLQYFSSRLANEILHSTFYSRLVE